MKKQLLLLFLLSFSITCLSQIKYENGYFISNTGKKTNCLIKNLDWLENPTEFVYKLSSDDKSQIKTIKSVKEFGIDSITKYIRSTLNLDISSDDNDNLSDERKPKFTKKTMFLKVLVEGEASLYQYIEGDLKRFFYSLENSNTEQLIYKRYKISDFKVAKNNRYKEQIRQNLVCSNITLNKIKNLVYQKHDLINLIIAYNNCKNQEFINYEQKRERDKFNLSVRPGISSSSLSIDLPNSSTRDADFDRELSFRLGVELEYILPFNKNKWSVLVEPTYQYFKSETRVQTENVKADYESIEMPFGLRHYFFLTKNSKIFINACYVFDFAINSKIGFEISSDQDINSKVNSAFGLGYKNNDKYSVEIRYQTSRELFFEVQLYESDYRTLSVIFAYSIF